MVGKEESLEEKDYVPYNHDTIHKDIEIYIDDTIAKLAKEENHMENLHKLFERLRRYRLRLNPTK